MLRDINLNRPDVDESRIFVLGTSRETRIQTSTFADRHPNDRSVSKILLLNSSDHFVQDTPQTTKTFDSFVIIFNQCE